MYDTSPELYPDDEPHQTFLNARDSNEAVDGRMDPTPFELLAYAYALESFRDHERYRLPHEGGSQDQPYLWKLAVDCVTDAIGAAKAQARAEARAKAREE